jgi:hypothetical protein
MAATLDGKKQGKRGIRVNEFLTLALYQEWQVQI